MVIQKSIELSADINVCGAIICVQMRSLLLAKQCGKDRL